MVAVATLTPAGVGGLGKWKFRREVDSHDFRDGKKSTDPKTWKGWVNDDSGSNHVTLVFDNYCDSDAPQLNNSFAMNSSETYNNFRQWIEWDGVPCSDCAYWHYLARWRRHANPKKEILLNDLDVGHKPLPATPTFP